MENGENFSWKVLLFVTWGCFFHLGSLLFVDKSTDFKSERVNRA